MKAKPYLFSTSSHPDTIHINPLDISFTNVSINFSDYDYIILTSKQAVKALNNYAYNEYKNTQALCISEATAQSYKEIGGSVLEMGSGYGNNLTKSISGYPRKTKWLYLRAKVIASDFAQESRSAGYDIDEVIVYESQCSLSIKSISITDNATLIFTSPSSVKCFLKYNEIKESHRVAVIGKTTAAALPLSISPKIASEPSIKSCLKIIN